MGELIVLLVCSYRVYPVRFPRIQQMSAFRAYVDDVLRMPQ